jgi:hypothetical protein
MKYRRPDLLAKVEEFDEKIYRRAYYDERALEKRIFDITVFQKKKPSKEILDQHQQAKENLEKIGNTYYELKDASDREEFTDLDKELYDAVHDTNYDAVKKALDKGADPSGSVIKDSLLSSLVEDNHVPEGERIIRLLIERGSDPNSHGEYDHPLYYAAKNLKMISDEKEEYNYTDEDGESYMRTIDLLCQHTSPENIKRINTENPGLLPESCLSKAATARVEPAMKALESQTNKSYRAPPGTYDVPPGFSESVGEYAFGIKTPRPTAGKRKQKRKTNKRRKTTKRRKTLKKF